MPGAKTPPVVTEGIREGIRDLESRYRLPSDAATQLAALIEMVATDPLSPTAVREPTAVLNDHLADSLVALDLAEVRSAVAVADLGSGAGFPGLPLAVALPTADVALVESSGRKCVFIDRLITACNVHNARAVSERAEDWPEGGSRFDLITARAVAPLAVVAEYAAPLLRIGGSLVAWRGRRDPGAEAAAARAAAALGLEVRETIAVDPYPAAQYRHLHRMSKVTETPSGFPRRPGIARKRPLGGR